MVKELSSPSLDGWLVLDKPQDMSSARAVALVRRALGAPKAGHGGTLDPLATGVLPIALGEATKTMSFVMNGAKTYRFAVKWGSETSTDDTEGDVTVTSDERPSRQAILDLLPQFTGEVDQVPPAFSAVKVGGARSYARARQGEAIELSPRTVRIDALTLLSAAPEQAEFELHCGKGTYVRALARDMGRRLGCFGHVAALRRIRAGPFTEADMISLALLDEFGHNSAGRKAVLKALRPLRTVLDDIPALALSAAEAGRLKQGQPVRLRTATPHPERQPVLAVEGEKPVALSEVKDGFLHARRVFNL